MSVPDKGLGLFGLVEWVRQFYFLSEAFIPFFCLGLRHLAVVPFLSVIFPVGAVDGDPAIVGFEVSQMVAVAIYGSAVGEGDDGTKICFENPFVVLVLFQLSTVLGDDSAVY